MYNVACHLKFSVTQFTHLEKKENDPICRNRNADVENGPMARGKEVGEGRSWESSAEIHAVPCVNS